MMRRFVMAGLLMFSLVGCGSGSTSQQFPGRQFVEVDHILRQLYPPKLDEVSSAYDTKVAADLVRVPDVTIKRDEVSKDGQMTILISERGYVGLWKSKPERRTVITLTDRSSEEMSSCEITVRASARNYGSLFPSRDIPYEQDRMKEINDIIVWGVSSEKK